MAINLKQKTYLSLVIFGILTLLILVLAVYPLMKEIKKNSEEFVLHRGKLIFFEQKKNNLREIQELYKSYEQNLDKLETYFVDLEAPIEFISFLEENAAKSELLIDIVSLPSKEIKGDLWPSISFQLILVGSFPDSLKFLEKLENNPYLIEILTLDIKRLTERDLGAIFSQMLGKGKKIASGDVKTTLFIKAYIK